MQGYRHIAIYGIGDVGKLCYDELIASNEVNIAYIIDMAAKGDYKGCPIVSLDYVDDKVEAIIITPIYCYLDIAGVLYERTKAKLISLEDMVKVLNEYEGN